MSSKIIEFQQSPQSTIAREPEKLLAEGQFEIERRRKEIARRVREAADKNQKFDPRDDRIGPAQEIDRLIVEGHVKFKKDQLKGLHLERLRLDRKLPAAEARKAGAKGLILSIQPYVRLLDVIAANLARAPDDVIYNAFRDTIYAQADSISVDDPASDLESLIHEMARFVIRSERLPDYFQLACTIASEYHPGRGDYGGMFVGVDYEGVDMPPESAPRFPAVSLLRVHETFGAHYMDIRLVIGPRRWIGIEGLRDHDLVPMFETQLHGGCTGTSIFPEVLISSNQVLHDEFVYFPRVHAATIGGLMGYLSKRHWEPSQIRPSFSRVSWLCPLIGPHAKPSEFRYEARPCREFETALYTGAIETALAENCRDLKARLEKRIAERKATLDRQDEAMLARWRKTDSDGNSGAE